MSYVIHDTADRFTIEADEDGMHLIVDGFDNSTDYHVPRDNRLLLELVKVGEYAQSLIDEEAMYRASWRAYRELPDAADGYDITDPKHPNYVDAILERHER